MYELNNIYNEDCMQATKALDMKFDIIIADPMFDEWENYYDMPLHLLKKDGVLITFSQRPHTSKLQMKLDSKLRFLTEIVWHFSDGRWVSNKLPMLCHENIMFHTPSKKLNPLKDMKLVDWITKPKSSLKGNSSIGKWSKPNKLYVPSNNAIVSSVISIPRNMNKPLGAISKPESLCDLIIDMTTDPNDIVLDMFCGSGNFCLSSIRKDRKYIAFENDYINYDIAKKRIEIENNNSEEESRYDLDKYF